MTNRQAAIKIIEKLRREGFQALLAGGCVRDMLLGRRAKDYDVATEAKPQDVMRLFKRTLKVGGAVRRRDRPDGEPAGGGRHVQDRKRL